MGLKKLALFSLSVLVLQQAAWGSTRKLDKFIKSLAKELTRNVAPRGESIAVPSFLTFDNRNTMLGKYISEELLNQFAQSKKLVPVERDFIFELTDEMKLGMSGMVSSGTIQDVGRFSGAAYVIVGTLQKIGDSVRVNVRLVRTESSKVIETISDSLDLTPEVAELLAQDIKITHQPVKEAKQEERKENAEPRHAGPQEPEVEEVTVPRPSGTPQEKVIVFDQEYFEAPVDRESRRQARMAAERQAESDMHAGNEIYYQKRERELEQADKERARINSSAASADQSRLNRMDQEEKALWAQHQKDYQAQIRNANRPKVVILQRPRLAARVHNKNKRYP